MVVIGTIDTLVIDFRFCVAQNGLLCILHTARGAMVDLSHESAPKSDAGVAVQNVERSRTSFYM